MNRMQQKRRTRRDPVWPVVPRMWHGPVTHISKEVQEHGIDPAAYGIDVRHARKWTTFTNAVSS